MRSSPTTPGGDRCAVVADDGDVGVRETASGLGHGAVHGKSVGDVGHRDVQRAVTQQRRTAEVATVERGVLPQSLGEGGPSHDPGGAFALDHVQRRLADPARQDQHRGRLRGAPGRGEQSADPEERHRTQNPRVAVASGDGSNGGGPGRGLSDQGAVRVDDTLGVRGGSRRVHHDGEVGGGHLGLGRGQRPQGSRRRRLPRRGGWPTPVGVAGDARCDAGRAPQPRTSRPDCWSARSGSAASNRSATSTFSTLSGAISRPMSASLTTLAISAGVYIVLSGTASARSATRRATTRPSRRRWRRTGPPGCPCRRPRAAATGRPPPNAARPLGR